MPKMTIDLTSTEILNITVTKSFLQLLTTLGDAFEKASKQVEPPKQRELPGTSPYLVRNETGISIKVRNSDTLKCVGESPSDAPQSEFVHLDTTEGEQVIGLQPEEDRKGTELILQLLGKLISGLLARFSLFRYRTPDRRASRRNPSHPSEQIRRLRNPMAFGCGNRARERTTCD